MWFWGVVYNSSPANQGLRLFLSKYMLTFCMLLPHLTQQALCTLLPTPHPPTTNLLSLSVTQSLLKMQTHTVCWRFSSLCLLWDTLPLLRTLFYILISTVTGGHVNAYKSNKQGPVGLGRVSKQLSENSKNKGGDFSICALTVGLIRQGKPLEQCTVMKWLLVHLCDKQAGNEHHLVTLTDLCQQQRSHSTCFVFIMSFFAHFNAPPVHTVMKQWATTEPDLWHK